MTNKQAQANARECAEAGDLRARWNEAALEGREAAYRKVLLELSTEYAELRAAGRYDEARLVKEQGAVIVNQFFGVQE